jgi:hypothetical protein
MFKFDATSDIDFIFSADHYGVSLIVIHDIKNKRLRIKTNLYDQMKKEHENNRKSFVDEVKGEFNLKFGSELCMSGRTISKRVHEKIIRKIMEL